MIKIQNLLSGIFTQWCQILSSPSINTRIQYNIGSSLWNQMVCWYGCFFFHSNRYHMRKRKFKMGQVQIFDKFCCSGSIWAPNMTKCLYLIGEIVTISGCVVQSNFFSKFTQATSSKVFFDYEVSTNYFELLCRINFSKSSKKFWISLLLLK